LPSRRPRGKPSPTRNIENVEQPVEKSEMAKVERYLRRTFANHSIRVVGRPKKDDSAEVYIGEEFVGVLFVDDEDEDRSYNFQMAILDVDLED
jgi:hypothetical protein